MCPRHPRRRVRARPAAGRSGAHQRRHGRTDALAEACPAGVVLRLRARLLRPSGLPDLGLERGSRTPRARQTARAGASCRRRRGHRRSRQREFGCARLRRGERDPLRVGAPAEPLRGSDVHQAGPEGPGLRGPAQIQPGPRGPGRQARGRRGRLPRPRHDQPQPGKDAESGGSIRGALPYRFAPPFGIPASTGSTCRPAAS